MAFRQTTLTFTCALKTLHTSWRFGLPNVHVYLLVFASAEQMQVNTAPTDSRFCSKHRRGKQHELREARCKIIVVVLSRTAIVICKHLGEMSQTLALILFSIHSTRYEEILFSAFNNCSSTSFEPGDSSLSELQHCKSMPSPCHPRRSLWSQHEPNELWFFPYGVQQWLADVLVT